MSSFLSFFLSFLLSFFLSFFLVSSTLLNSTPPSIEFSQTLQDVGPSGSSLGDQVYANGNVYEPAPGGGIPAADAPIVGRFDLSAFVTANLNATTERRQVRATAVQKERSSPRFFPYLFASRSLAHLG